MRVSLYAVRLVDTEVSCGCAAYAPPPRRRRRDRPSGRVLSRGSLGGRSGGRAWDFAGAPALAPRVPLDALGAAADLGAGAGDRGVLASGVAASLPRTAGRLPPLLAGLLLGREALRSRGAGTLAAESSRYGLSLLTVSLPFKLFCA